jgi:hypothetical protein
LDSYEFKSEIIAISIPVWDKNIYVANLYNLPRTPLNSEDINYVVNKNNLILLGDFNANHPYWSRDKMDPSGEQLADIIETDNLEIANTGEPTRLDAGGHESIT